MTADRTALVTTQGLDHRMSEVVADPTSAFAVAQRAAYVAADTLGRQEMLLARQRASKGGVIGVGNRGVIALRFDDWHAAFQSSVFPQLLSRGLPAGFATIARLAEQPWSAGSSAAQIKNWNAFGVEIHSHGIDHKDPSPNGDAGLVAQIVTSRAEIEAFGVKVQGWMQPGATPLGAAVPYGTDFTTFDGLLTRAGQLIRQNYPHSEAYIDGAVRNLPHGAFHGLDHITVSDAMTLATAKTWVDTAARDKVGVELMCHSGNLGLAGNMTVADYIALLDYVMAAWDAGTIEVLTPSGLMFADKSANRLDLWHDSDFENVTTGATVGWDLANWTGKTIETTGGHSGAKFLRIDNATTTFVGQRAKTLKTRGLAGETLLFDGWARSNGVATTTSRVLIQSYVDTTPLNLSLTKASIPTTWTHVRHAFTIPPGVDQLTVGLGRNSGDGIDWDDVHVWKV